MIKLEEFRSKSIEDERQTVEILGVAKFGNLQISQVSNFRNLRTLLMPVPIDCFLIHLLVVNTCLPLCNFDSLIHFCNFLFT